MNRSGLHPVPAAHPRAAGDGTATVAYTERGLVSAEDFGRRVAALAGALAPRAERRWALACDDTLAFAVGLKALLLTGRNPVLPHAPQAASVSAIEPRVEAVLSDRPERYTSLPALAVEQAPGTKTASGGPDPALQLEFYTSGSSGTPKRVIKPWGQLQAEVESLEQCWGAQLGEAVVLATVPHYHLYGLLFRVLWPLWAGRPLYTRTLLQPLEVGETGKRFPRSAVVSSPAFLTRVLDFQADFPGPAGLAAVFSSGAPLPAVCAEQARAGLGQPVTEIYGSTETGGIAWRGFEPGREHGPWTPFATVRTETRASDGDPRPQLFVRSPWTQEQDWTATGDLAQFDSDGRFRLLGRADSLVKLEDKRISLAELGAWLGQHAWVAETRLTLVAGKRQVIGAAVVLNAAGQAALAAQGARAVRETLSTACLARYDAVLTPRKWRFVDSLPVNALGKVADAELQALFRERA